MRIGTLAIAALALTIGGFAAYGQTPPTNLDAHPVAPFPGLIASRPASAPPWSTTTTTDTLVLENQTDPGAIRYYFTDHPETYGRRTLTVRVESTGDANSRGGLLYGMNQAGNAYYLFMLEGDGTVALYQRSPQGMARALSAPALAGVNELTIVEIGDQAEFYANGEYVFSNLGFGEGRVGIASFGVGRYVFHDYEEVARADLATAVDAWTGQFTPTPAAAERDELRKCLDREVTARWDRQILADAFVAAAEGTLTPTGWQEQAAGREEIIDGMAACGLPLEQLF